MVGLSDVTKELAEAGAAVVAASVDPLDKAREVASELSFPVGYQVSREMADALGSWWEDRRGIIQPSEFLLGPDDKIRASSYSDGPLGRMNPPDVVKMVNFLGSRE